MTPEQALHNLGALLARVDQIRASIAAEARRADEQWTQLGRLSGQRADHAAALLAKLGAPLQELARFAGRAVEQIEEFQTDPFKTEFPCPS